MLSLSLAYQVASHHERNGLIQPPRVLFAPALPAIPSRGRRRTRRPPYRPVRSSPCATSARKKEGSEQQSAGRTRNARPRASVNMSSFRELSPSRILYADILLSSLSPTLFPSLPFRLPHRSTSILNRPSLFPPTPPCLSRYIFSYLSFGILLLPSYNRNARRAHVPFLREERSINETKGNAPRRRER